MITGINKTYESIKIGSDVRNREMRGKAIEEVNNWEYNWNSDYSFLDLDRLIMAVIEGYSGKIADSCLAITTPKFQKNVTDKGELKFSKEVFDIIKPLVDAAYEKKSLGDLEYDKYEEYIAMKVYNIAVVAMDVVMEFSGDSNKPIYDEQSLRKSADDYFMEELNKKDVKSIQNESISNQYDHIRNVAKFRIMNNKECKGILAELKTLI